MNKEDIIRMAREAGLIGVGESKSKQIKWVEKIIEDQCIKFAHLVAAIQREACAKVAQETVCDQHIPTGIKIYGTKAAKAIRARGKE